MPAVTADTLTLTKLPERRARAPASAPSARVTTAPAGLRGRGLPGAPGLRRHRLRRPRPVHHDGRDGRGRLRPVRAARAPTGTRTAASRPSRTSSTARSCTRTRHGGGGVISNGATQWMTAGGGILHIETPPESLVVAGGLFHGLQLWVNLPSKDKMISPAYQNLEADLVKLVASPDGGALLRIIAGDVAGNVGPGSTHTPITVAHATVSPGARLVVPWRADFNALAYVLSGAGTRRRRAASDRRRPGRGVRRRRRRAGRQHRHRAAGDRPPRRRAAARARRPVRPVRDEPPPRAGPGGRRLQRRPPRHHPGRRPPAVPADR